MRLYRIFSLLKTNKVYYGLFLEIFIFFLCIALLNFQSCYSDCKTCYEDSENGDDMKCITCKKKNHSILYNISNCVKESHYNDYYIYKPEPNIKILYPCSEYEEDGCYECNPDLYSYGICLSCSPGFQFYEDENICEQYDNVYLKLILSDFDNCIRKGDGTTDLQYCNKYNTFYYVFPSGDFICPEITPIFNTYTNSCLEMDCPEEGFKNGTCIIHYQKYQDRKFYISWFNGTKINYPSINSDQSGYLLIELSVINDFFPHRLTLNSHKNRRLYFFDDEGRGLFDNINDIYEKVITYNKPYFRYMSISTAIKVDNDDEYKYLLNFEYYQGNLELINLKTGEASLQNLKILISEYSDIIIGDIYKENPAMIFLELRKKNTYLLGFLNQESLGDSKPKGITLIKFNFTSTEENTKIDINSFQVINFIITTIYPLDARISCIQTKNGYIFITFLGEEHYLKSLIYEEENFELIEAFKIECDLKDDSFFKHIFLKDEKSLVFLSLSELNCFVVIDIQNNEYDFITSYCYTHFEYEAIYHYSIDAIALTENRVIALSQKFHGRQITITQIDFFDDYNNNVITEFYINIINQKMHVFKRYSLIFKYKDLLGLQFSNIIGEHGFVLFGYFNSSDPKQIYNLKKDGLNYKIKLNEYLTLQSNIFNYKIKGIKILKAPNSVSSGLFFIFNNEKVQIKENDIVDFETNIQLDFKYNNILEKGNYLFKFAGVLEESTYEDIEDYSDSRFWSLDDMNEEEEQQYINIYNMRRNLNIVGKASLIQINILEDIQTFCDKKYDDNCLKSNDNKCLTCGEGIYYDVENANEITQFLPGENYYFDFNKNVYIKCFSRCKKCSKEYNNTNMQCDECLNSEKFYLTKEKNCLEISYCEYNFYYDYNFDLFCINKTDSCPDIKPYELKSTKECIEKCNLNEFETRCNPTNNIISINQTYTILNNNINNLNLDKLLFVDKKKYLIYGNNVSFIFSTTEIEKDELNINFNSSSILLNECEDILRKEYSVPEDKPFIILKIETTNNNTNYMNSYYEIHNPFNFSEKLNLDICQNKTIEIRAPIQMKKYHLDLINTVKNLGYNIFDLNDPFYTDICTVFSYNNSDISLSERRNLLNLSNEIYCMHNCNFTNIDINTMRSICQCNANYSELNNNEKNNLTEKDEYIYDMFKSSLNFSKSSNIKVVKCFKIIFISSHLKKNYGFYLMLLTNFINISLLLIYPFRLVDQQLHLFSVKILNQIKEVYNNIDIKNRPKKEKEEEKMKIRNNIIKDDNIKPYKNRRLL